MEVLHAFKVGWYLDADYEIRRLLWTLGHAHGTLLSLVHVTFGATAYFFPTVRAGGRRMVSPLLVGASILLPGGFSYGDALGAGGRLALELRTWFADELASAVRDGRPVLGICNGFQVLVKSGLLPGPVAPSGRRQVTLTANERGVFEGRWVHLEVTPGCR